MRHGYENNTLARVKDPGVSVKSLKALLVLKTLLKRYNFNFSSSEIGILSWNDIFQIRSYQVGRWSRRSLYRMRKFTGKLLKNVDNFLKQKERSYFIPEKRLIVKKQNERY